MYKQMLREKALKQSATLGLLRVIDGYVAGSPHWLGTEVGSETEVGSLAVKEGSLLNVGDDVSKRHGRVWRGEDGQWYVEGLGSRNGITLVDGGDRSVKVVEPPEAERKNWESKPVPPASRRRADLRLRHALRGDNGPAEVAPSEGRLFCPMEGPRTAAQRRLFQNVAQRFRFFLCDSYSVLSLLQLAVGTEGKSLAVFAIRDAGMSELLFGR